MHSIGRVQVIWELSIVIDCISKMPMRSCWDTEIS
jgi:hypothetical protein